MITIEIPMNEINYSNFIPVKRVTDASNEDTKIRIIDEPTYFMERTPTYTKQEDDYKTQPVHQDSVMDDLVSNPKESDIKNRGINTIKNRGNYNIKAAIDTIHKNVKINLQTGKPKDETKYTHWCAKSVRLALQQGGLDMSGRPNYGGQYGPYLLSKGWVALPKGSKPEAGDVAVTIPHGSKKGGHIALFDGKDWYSDAKQRSMYVYRTANDNNTTIYRYAG